VFVPEHLRYVNLDLRVVRTLYHEFPKLQHAVIVRDREGRPITGLDSANFRVLERGIQMEELSIAPTFREKDRAALVFVVDRSPAMVPHAARLQEIARALLESLPGKDRVQVINANGSRAFISQPFIGNVLSPLEGMRRGPVSERPLIGRALYMAGTDLFAHESRHAIVLFTAGEFGDREYAPYGFQTCLQFARNNGIPVYVVKFGAGPEMDRLTRLAEETGGALYDGLTSNAVYRLRETLFARPLFEYALYYRTSADERLRGTFREFTVEVRYKELFGHDRSGYYIPE
jgi:Mg-chelatase subunit ChlD